MGLNVRGDNTNIQNCTFENNTYGIYGDRAHYTNIQNCTFKNDTYGIEIRYSNNINISFNNISYSSKGLEVDTWSWSDQGYIYNNEVHHNGDGMVIEGGNFIIKNNTIHNNTNDGILLIYLYDSYIYNNTIKDNSGDYNLGIYYGYNLLIHNNTIQKLKNGGDAVYITDGNDINFYNNTVTYNNETGVYIYLTSDYSNIYIHNNNISKNNSTGLVGFGPSSTTPYIEIINNDFYDNGDGSTYSRGIGLQRLRSYTIKNNIINSNTGNPSYAGHAVWVDDAYGGDFSNNTLNGTPYDFYLDDLWGDPDDTFFNATNCTFNITKVGFKGGAPTLVIKNFLHVCATDVNGTVPDVNISTKDSWGTTVFWGKTDKDGYLRYIKLTNQTINQSEVRYFDPYNITGDYDGNISYGDIDPTMNKSQIVNVHFNVDLRPETPKNLKAVGNGIDVDLSWTPSHSSDIHHYLVYRNGTASDWIEVYNSSLNPPYETWNNWTDPNAALDWTTYSYKVQAVDNISQHSYFSNIAKCGDWAVKDTIIITNFTVELNGSLTILPTGNLTFKNVTLKINNSYELEYGINVKSGGKLSILDNDNDPKTTNDQSNITALDPNNNFYFIVNGSRFEMKNSRLSDCGSNESLEYSFWDEWTGPLVMSQGPSIWYKGLYIKGSNMSIENNSFLDNFISIFMNDTHNGSVMGNTFSDNVFGIYMNGSDDNVINDNSFDSHQAFSIYLYNSGNNTIDFNNITNLPDTGGGIVLYDRESKLNKIINNNYTEGKVGLNLYYAGTNNSISNNNFTNIDMGIYILESSWNFLSDNNFIDINSEGCYMRDSHFTTIKGGTSNLVRYGYRSYDSDNIMISDIIIENASYQAISIGWGDNLNITNISIKSCDYGIQRSGGYNSSLTDINIEDCIYGISASQGAKEITLHNSRIFNDVINAISITQCENFMIYNSTLNATFNNFRLTSAGATLFNTTYNQTKVDLDSKSSISLYWLLDVRVLDWLGNPVDNANVQIRNLLGTLVYNGSTDVGGLIKWIWLQERTQYYNSNVTSRPYQIQAISGNHTGSATLNTINQSTKNITVYLDNSEPSVSNVIISPLNPTTIYDLTLDYTFSDPEDDPEGSTQILWYINGVPNSTFDNQKIIDSQFTKKDQTWYCKVTPHDGANYGKPMTSTPVTIQNTPPEVTNVIIEDTNPTSADSLHVTFTFTDIDGDDDIQSMYRWFVDNGSGAGFVYSGVDSLELDASYTVEGELWMCIVTPGDGDDLGNPEASNIIEINNSAPEVYDVAISPASPQSNDILTASYGYFDLDGEDDSGSRIRWYKDNDEQWGLNDSDSVDFSLTQKGETWYYI
ncbi:MAG: right-handed parallel beta-helix repeat-containing protein, partial [Thermoplasmata archaeon]